MTVMLPKEKWTDHRLDDLNRKVDDGFAQVDKRFAQVDKRFDRVESDLREIRSEIGSLQRTLTTGAVMIVAALIGAHFI